MDSLVKSIDVLSSPIFPSVPRVDLVVVVVVVHIRPGILIVWISTADIYGVARHHVDTGLKRLQIIFTAR